MYITKNFRHILKVILFFTVFWGGAYLGHLLEVGETVYGNWYDFPFYLSLTSILMIILAWFLNGLLGGNRE